jgi:hypothetical protein
MLKPISALAVDDWVVTESLVISRRIGKPWKVQSIAKSRIYLVRELLNPKTQVVEDVRTKFVALKSIRYVFTDEASAQAAADFAHDNSDVYERKARELAEEHKAVFLAFMEALPLRPLAPVGGA